MDIKEVFASMVLILIFFKKKKKKACGSGTEKEDISNKELAEELHKTVIRKFQKWKVPSPFIDNIWDADLAEMQRISKCDIWISFLLCFTDIFSKYAWVIPLKNKNALQLRMLPKKILEESNCKPTKMWVDKGSECYNRTMKSFFRIMI